MFILTKDGSILDKQGRVVFFSISRFIKDICEGNCCFICGAKYNETEFNDEHILPKWILRKYNLFDRKIGLPNLSDFRYDRYVIPCCISCNKLMNKKIEQPIKNLLTQGYETVTKYIRDNGPWLFFEWLNLIYLKTHLKDKQLKLNIKSETNNKKISGYYNWEELHHIHCIARAFYTNVDLNKKALGSFLVLPAKVARHFENYDYADMYHARTILLRLEDIAFISVLNDSCGAINLAMHLIKKITGSLSPIQLREIFGRLAFGNIYLQERPSFFSDVNIKSGKIKISAYSPSKTSIGKYDPEEFGALLYFCCRDFFPSESTDQNNYILQNLKLGKYTFLIDENEKFISTSMDLI